jgi:hypothetical protein
VWQSIRAELPSDEALFFVLKLALWPVLYLGGMSFTSWLSMQNVVGVRFVKGLTRSVRGCIGASALGTICGICACVLTAAFFTSNMIPSLTPPIFAYPLFILYHNLGVFLLLRLYTLANQQVVLTAPSLGPLKAALGLGASMPPGVGSAGPLADDPIPQAPSPRASSFFIMLPSVLCFCATVVFGLSTSYNSFLHKFVIMFICVFVCITSQATRDYCLTLASGASSTMCSTRSSRTAGAASRAATAPAPSPGPGAAAGPAGSAASAPRKRFACLSRKLD